MGLTICTIYAALHDTVLQTGLPLAITLGGGPKLGDEVAIWKVPLLRIRSRVRLRHRPCGCNTYTVQYYKFLDGERNHPLGAGQWIRIRVDPHSFYRLDPDPHTERVSGSRREKFEGKTEIMQEKWKKIVILF